MTKIHEPEPVSDGELRVQRVKDAAAHERAIKLLDGLYDGRCAAAWFLYEHPDSERWVDPQRAIGWRNQDFGAYDRGFFDGWMQIFRSIPRVPNPPCETCGVEMRVPNFSTEVYCANERCVKYVASLFGRRCRNCSAIVADCCC